MLHFDWRDSVTFFVSFGTSGTSYFEPVEYLSVIGRFTFVDSVRLKFSF